MVAIFDDIHVRDVGGIASQFTAATSPCVARVIVIVPRIIGHDHDWRFSIALEHDTIIVTAKPGPDQIGFADTRAGNAAGASSCCPVLFKCASGQAHDTDLFIRRGEDEIKGLSRRV